MIRRFSLRKVSPWIILVCLLVLAAQLLEIFPAKAEDSLEVNQLLVFFRNVLQIDTTRCTVTGGGLSGPGYDNSPELGIRGISDGKVTLAFDSGGSVDSLYEFRGKYLVWCLVYYDIGNTDPIPYIKQPSGDQLEMVRSFLVRYQMFTNDLTISKMNQMLNNLTNIEQVSKTDGNLKMTITVREGKPDFEWSYTFEEEDYKLLSISFFSPPHIFTLGDQRYKYNMNSSAIPEYESLNGNLNAEASSTSFSSQQSPSNAVTSSNLRTEWVNPYSVAFLLAVMASSLFGSVLLIRFKVKRIRGHFSLQHLMPSQSFFLRLEKSSFKKKIPAISLLFLLFLSLEVGLQSIQFGDANFMYAPLERISITSDGSISPQSNSITRSGDVYTLNADITNYPLEIQRDNIVIEGAGFTLQKNIPAFGRQDAVVLKGRNNVTIRNLNIQGYDYGIFVSTSYNCDIIENKFSNNKYGIVLADRSSNNLISANNWFSGGGISIYTSPNNILKNNSINGIGPNFWIDCENITSVSDFVNNVDQSNTIKGKPICYWINQQNKIVPTNAGYVVLVNCTNATVENLNLANNGQGILLISTQDTQVSNNNITGNNKGIAIYDSPNNNFTSNNLTNNTYGIICRSRPNTFSNNILDNNTNDANFEDRFFDEFDRSNIVDGKPICYMLWQHGKSVPLDSGYVVLLSCQNITVQNLNITQRKQGMYLAGLQDSLILRNIVTNNEAGIIMKGTSNNRILGNLVSNNTDGIYIEASQQNEISGNKIVFNNNIGIDLEDTDDTKIAYNYISHCRNAISMNRGKGNLVHGNTMIYTRENGMRIGESIDNTITGNNIAWSKGYALSISGNVGNNSIYNNDFVNNAMSAQAQAYPGANSQNIWDDGQKGNFWSDYQERYPTAKEKTASGIWDTPATMNANNIDRFPLTAPVNMKYQVTILQPASISYDIRAVTLVTLATGPTSWSGYSLDGNENVTIKGDTLLSGLSEGVHTITAYAGKEGGPCASETIRFQIGQKVTPLKTPDPSITNSANPDPTGQPTNDQSPVVSPTNSDTANYDADPLPFLVGPIALTLSIAGVALGVLLYLKKRKVWL